MLSRNKHNRRSIKLKEYDYSWPGFYFVNQLKKHYDNLFAANE